MVACDVRVTERPLVVSRLTEVVSEHRCELLEPVGVQPLQRGSYAQVERAAIAQEDRPVRRLLREAVVERVLPLGAPIDLTDESGQFQRVQSPVELRTVAGDRAQDRLVESSTDHRGELQRASRVLIQGVEARRDNGLQGGRDGVGRAFQPDRRGQLLQEQRVALGPLEDPRADDL